MTRITFAAALLLLAGCARSEEASLVPPDSNQGYNQVGSVGTPEADDMEPAIGQWRASLQENVQALEFGPVGTEPLFSLVCAGNRSVILQRHGGVPAGPLPAMQLNKGQLNERVPVTTGGGAIPMLRAEVPLQSPLAQAIGAGAEPLMIRLDDGAPLILPASPLVGDYLRSCTTAQPLPAAANGQPGAAPAGNAAATNGAAPAQPAANSAAPANSAAAAPGNTSQPRP